MCDMMALSASIGCVCVGSIYTMHSFNSHYLLSLCVGEHLFVHITGDYTFFVRFWFDKRKILILLIKGVSFIVSGSSIFIFWYNMLDVIIAHFVNLWRAFKPFIRSQQSIWFTVQMLTWMAYMSITILSCHFSCPGALHCWKTVYQSKDRIKSWNQSYPNTM